MSADRWAIHCGDALEVMRSMADSSVDAVVTDPPYFKVKDEAWDHAWDTPAKFLAWFDQLAEQWARVLKPNGTMYVFASPRMASRVEVKLAERFDILNSIVWDKGQHGTSIRCSKEGLRSFLPFSERIMFAQHYGADNAAKGEAGYVRKCDELRGFLFEPLRAYLAGEWERAGLIARDANAATGTQMAGHWFTHIQWALPTAKHYATLQAYANRNGGEYLRREYEYLRREYEDLRREYEDLRRPFNITADDQFGDVWRFDTPANFEGRHVCEKPVPLLQHILNASTKPGALVLDCFAGSASTGHACLSLGRRFLGIELSPDWVQRGSARLTAVESGATSTVLPHKPKDDAQLELFA